MPQKERDYSNLRETKDLYEAIHDTSTHVRDYSMTHTVLVSWRSTANDIRRRLVRINIGGHEWIGEAPELTNIINDIADLDDIYGGIYPVTFTNGNLELSTESMNREGLRDHIGVVTIDGNSAIIDLEELLKAIRYA